jgi:hypothetical protein
MRTVSGALITIASDEVDEIVRRRPIFEEYHTRRRAAPDTALAHWELAEWCRQNSLGRERRDHLLRVIALDPDHVAAHRGLGHVRHAGRWSTPEQVLASRGLVKHNGKHVRSDDFEETLDDERANARERDWSKRVRRWHGWLGGDHHERQAAGRAELSSIRDPDAVPALARALRSEADESRRLVFVGVLSEISGGNAVAALARQSIDEESESVRETALQAVLRKDLGPAIPVYVRALKSRSNPLVNRAGLALSQVGGTSALRPMIEAVVTRHEYTVEIPNPEPFICTEGQNSTGSVVLPPSVALQLLSSGMMPLVAQNMPKPVPGQEAEKEMITVTFSRDEENAGVLEGLVRLTGQNFGFDKLAWRRWFNGQSRGGSRSKNQVP